MITPPYRWACKGRGDVLYSRLHSLARNPGLSDASPPTPHVKCVSVDFCRMEEYRRQSLEVSIVPCLPQPWPCMDGFWALDQLPF